MTGTSIKSGRAPMEISEIEAAYVAAALKLALDHYGSRLLPLDREIMHALKVAPRSGPPHL